MTAQFRTNFCTIRNYGDSPRKSSELNDNGDSPGECGLANLRVLEYLLRLLFHGGIGFLVH